MQFLHVTIQGTLCLNMIVIAEKSPYSYHMLFQCRLIFCRCPIKWKLSFITANMNKHNVSFLPTSGLSVCTILHVLILNGFKYLIKDVPYTSKD